MAKSSKKILSFSLAALATTALLAIGAAGCSDDGTDDGCFDYSSFSASTVTFKADVLPIFRNSCGLSGSCHGSKTPAAPGQPFLGLPNSAGEMMQADIDAIFEQNVGVAATKATGMKIVEAGSPKTSFLMHKMDDTLTCADVKCDAACGAAMPLGSGVLDETARGKVRSWIAGGAKND
jgi:hypothetical protein